MLRPPNSELEALVASAADCGESVIIVLLGLGDAIGRSLISSGAGACVKGPMSSIIGASPAAGFWSTGAGAGVGAVCVKPTMQSVIIVNIHSEWHDLTQVVRYMHWFIDG